MVISQSHKHTVNIKRSLNYVFLLAPFRKKEQIIYKYQAKNLINALKTCLGLNSNEKRESGQMVTALFWSNEDSRQCIRG